MGSTKPFRRVSELLNWTDRQSQAWDALQTHRFLLYGGARGGGKSRFLRWCGIALLLDHARQGRRGVMGGLFCDTYPDLRDRHIQKISAEFPPWLGELKESMLYGLAFHLFPEYGDGAILLRNLDDPSKYKSSELAFILWDELTEIGGSLEDPTHPFNVLRGSLRWPGVERPVMVGGTNPDGPGNLWVRDLWIEHKLPVELEPLRDEFAFIPALPSDNPYLSEQYWKDLNTLPEDLRKAWVEGSWYVFSGQAFKAWSEIKHVCEPFQLPAYWPRIRGIDWGTHAPFVCLWGAIDPDTGRLYIYRELVQTDLTDRQQAKAVREMTAPGEQILATYADPSMWNKKNLDNVVSSTANEYSKENVPLMQGNNDRIGGKRRIDRLLANLPDGRPGMIVFSTCAYLRRTLPALPYDKVQIEDVDTKADDHGYDALKYLSTHMIAKVPKQTKRQTVSGLEQMLVRR